MYVFLSLGTNLGDRQKNVRTALALLDRSMRSHFVACSEVVETQAVGFEGPPFLNCVVCYRTRREPSRILQICKRIEREMGRRDAPEYDVEGERVFHDRIIDIDILVIPGFSVDTENLTVPHKRLPQRPFFAELINSMLESGKIPLESERIFGKGWGKVEV